MNAETVYENDDVEGAAMHIPNEAIQGMTTGEWVDLKNDLQSFLYRKENEDQPAFSDDVVFDWITANAMQFDAFYEKMKSERPK